MGFVEKGKNKIFSHGSNMNFWCYIKKLVFMMIALIKMISLGF